MSTRCTIAHSDDFHLYEECFEKDSVYLRLDDGDWAARLETATIDWHDVERTRPTLHVRIGIDLWRQIVEGWVSSHWGRHPERDHEKPDFDPEATNAWLSGLMRKQIKDKEEEK